jgi:hypothetical protein
MSHMYNDSAAGDHTCAGVWIVVALEPNSDRREDLCRIGHLGKESAGIPGGRLDGLAEGPSPIRKFGKDFLTNTEHVLYCSAIEQ